MSEQLIAEVLETEHRRRAALIDEDYQQVERIFADDLVYVHTSGMIHNKSEYLAYVRDRVRYLDMQRAQLNVRIYGRDTAVMTGLQTNTLQERNDTKVIQTEGFVTQVWVCTTQGWQITSFHSSRMLG